MWHAVRIICRSFGTAVAPLPCPPPCLRWYTICQCWRFEAIQKGRKREHYQWNMDIIGCKFVTAEAELIAALVDFLKATGLTSRDITIKINSRKILQRVLAAQGITGDLFGKVPCPTPLSNGLGLLQLSVHVSGTGGRGRGG